MKACIIDLDSKLRCYDISVGYKREINEAFIEIIYCSLNPLINHPEIYKNRKIEKPFIIGSEAVGYIKEVNENTSLRAGDRVIVYPWIFCNLCPRCIAGLEYLCELGFLLGCFRDGLCREHIVLPIRNLVKTSSEIPLEIASTLGFTGSTAYHIYNTIITRGGRNIAILNALNPIGIYLIQLLSSSGMNVITVSHERDTEYLINHYDIDRAISFSDINVLESLNIDTAILIVDPLCNISFNTSILSLKGRLVILDVLNLSKYKIDLSGICKKEIEIIGCRGSSRYDLIQCMNYAKRGILKPRILGIYGMYEYHDIWKLLTENYTNGSILIKI